MKKYDGIYHYSSCGLDNVYLNGGVFVQDVDGEECISITDAEGLHKVIAHELIKQERALTNKEFRFLRIELNLSQKELGDRLRVNEQTIANYEKGKTQLPFLVDLAIRELYEAGTLRRAIKSAPTAPQKKPVKIARMQFEKNSKDWHQKQAA